MKGNNIIGSTIIGRDNMGSVTGGNYTEQVQPTESKETKLLLVEVRNIVTSQQQPMANTFWDAFSNELDAVQPDKMKLMLLFEKVNSIIGQDKIGASLQLQITALIEKVVGA